MPTLRIHLAGGSVLELERSVGLAEALKSLVQGVQAWRHDPNFLMEIPVDEHEQREFIYPSMVTRFEFKGWPDAVPISDLSTLPEPGA